MNAPSLHSPRRFSRRSVLCHLGAGLAAGLVGCQSRTRPVVRLATFSADVTVPLDHAMMGGAWKSRSIADPLEARGFVLTGDGPPVVFVSVDWCEIRNRAYRRWQEALAAAAGTRPDHVLISTIHQHDAPVADLAAETILRQLGLAGTVCDPRFHETAVSRVAAALRASLASARPVNQLGLGKARVEQVASNRRYVMPDGTVRWDRTSATRNAFAIEADTGLIDPWLRTLSFWDGDEPVAAVSFYAVHPMSYYGQGEVSADFPGLARRARQQEIPGTFQLYVSGASGNITAGKFNTGARENRPILAERLHRALRAAWDDSRRVPLTRYALRVAPLHLEPRTSPGFTENDLQRVLQTETRPFQQCLAALGLSWRQRVESGQPLEIPCLDFGPAAVVVVPGESYIEYQLYAQSLRPSDFICVAAYGDGATGYIPTDAHWRDGDTNLGDWCWVAPGSEAQLKSALATALIPDHRKTPGNTQGQSSR